VPKLCLTRAHSSAFQRTNVFEIRVFAVSEIARGNEGLLAGIWARAGTRADVRRYPLLARLKVP
jgi:hypothetical protein